MTGIKIAVEMESYEQMTAYKYPRIFEIREALPMTATGKILKKELRETE